MRSTHTVSPSALTGATDQVTCRPGSAGLGVGSSLFRRLVLSALLPLKRGRLRMVFPDGTRADYGAPPGAALEALPEGVATAAEIVVRRESFFRRCVVAGDIGFAEAYLDGDWETPDITAVIAWFILSIDQAPTLSGSARRMAHGGLTNLMRLANRVGHLLRSNSRGGSRANISAHYDLSNDFFATFLDRSMMYSCARWSSADQSLEAAQSEKNEALCQALRLTPADHVLEIGTGWGGWALHAAGNHGCRVTTVTLSKEQHQLACERVALAGLGRLIDVRLCDYRDLQGRFDKIVSIEMMEAIGHQYLPAFTETVSRLLKRDGLAAFQFITCPDSRYEEFRSGVDFIQKHVFPGSLLLSLNRVNELMTRSGGFLLHALDDMGRDYARTLRLWHGRFVDRLEDVRALGFDERFIRKWRYYLAYCEAAFAMRNISVVQAVYTRPNNFRL